MRSTMHLRVAALAAFAGSALAVPNDYCGGLSAKLISDYGGNNTARDFCTNYLDSIVDTVVVTEPIKNNSVHSPACSAITLGTSSISARWTSSVEATVTVTAFVTVSDVATETDLSTSLTNVTVTQTVNVTSLSQTIATTVETDVASATVETTVTSTVDVPYVVTTSTVSQTFTSEVDVSSTTTTTSSFTSTDVVSSTATATVTSTTVIVPPPSHKRDLEGRYPLPAKLSNWLESDIETACKCIVPDIHVWTTTKTTGNGLTPTTARATSTVTVTSVVSVNSTKNATSIVTAQLTQVATLTDTVVVPSTSTETNTVNSTTTETDTSTALATTILSTSTDLVTSGTTLTETSTGPPAVVTSDVTTTTTTTSVVTTTTSTITASVTPCQSSNYHNYANAYPDTNNYDYNDGSGYTSKDDCCASCYALANCVSYFYYSSSDFCRRIIDTSSQGSTPANPGFESYCPLGFHAYSFDGTGGTGAPGQNPSIEPGPCVPQNFS